MTIKEVKRHLRRMAFHMMKRQREKLSKELMKELAASFKHEPHISFMDQPN